jgi:hypothetical protein
MSFVCRYIAVGQQPLRGCESTYRRLGIPTITGTLDLPWQVCPQYPSLLQSVYARKAEKGQSYYEFSHIND